jgi:tetratricopeptide (TPR) repeat protein
VASSDSSGLEKRCDQAWELKNQGQYDDAMTQFKLVLGDYPSCARAHLGLGLVYCFVGMFDEAVEELKLAVDCDPTWVEAHLNFAKTYAMLGLYDEAKVEFMCVLELQPGHPEAKKQLAFFEDGL